MGDKIDDAFNWLVLIMSTMNGVLINLTQTLEAKKATAGAVLIPFFVLVMIWLVGHLVKKRTYKVVLKAFAWFYALLMLGVFAEIFADQTFGALRTLNSVFMSYPLLASLFMAFMIGWPLLFFDRLVRPAYLKIYTDSTLISNRKKLVVLYIFATLTFLVQILPFLFLGVFQ